MIAQRLVMVLSLVGGGSVGKQKPNMRNHPFTGTKDIARIRKKPENPARSQLGKGRRNEIEKRRVRI